MVAKMPEMNEARSGAVVLGGRRVEPVHIWAALGVFVLFMIIYIWGSWVLGPYFKPTPLGADVPPLSVKIAARAVEVLSIIGTILLSYIFVFRPWRRMGRLSFDGIMILCCFTMYVQDPLLDYTTYWCLYNSYFLNFGSWLSYVPGVMTPNAHLLPEAPLAWFGAYTWFTFLPVVIACKAAEQAKRRWPDIGNFTIILVAYLAFTLLDFVVEGTFVRLGLYAFASCIPALTFFEGKFYQFPIYASLLWACIWLPLFLLRFYRDDKGRSFAERGLDRLKLSRRPKRALQFLAILGFCHTVMFVGYNVPMQWFATHGEAFPVEYPSYMRAGICGPDTPYDCAAPNVPIARRDCPTNRIVSQK